jgi:hypothetical protein
MTTPFWMNEPTILLNKEYIFDLWPTNNMDYERKVNAITRLILLITILGYIFTQSIKIIIAGLITVLILFILFKMKKQKITKDVLKENFQIEGDKIFNFVSNDKDKLVDPVTLETVLRSDFKEGTKKNPFSNVLLTEINDDPERNAAPPAFNPDVDVDITTNVKRAIQRMNPTIDNTNKQLFGDMWQNFELDQSNRIFYSTPNTRVANDQGAYANFLYGLMPSAKESDALGNMQRVKDNYRYILY